MTVTTPPSARNSSPIPFPSPSSSYSQYTSNPQNTPPRPASPIGGKRKQVKNACVNCQRACKKCDDQRPCSRCVKYGIEDGCINSQRKERKRKNQDDSTTAATTVNSSTRIQLNLSTRSRPHHPPVESPVPMRLSSRNGIRPFPKELLESLQHEEQDAEFDGDGDGRVEEYEQKPGGLEISPQVTEEFKTLAKICSDLHTVLSQVQMSPMPIPPVPQVQVPPHSPHMPQSFSNTTYHNQQQGHPPYLYHRQLNPFTFTHMTTDHRSIPHFHHHEHDPPRVSSPPPVLQRRSISPTQLHQMTQLLQQQQPAAAQLLLKPSSLIYNPQILQQIQIQQQQQQQGQQVILRDVLNRTPSEDDDIDEEAKPAKNQIHIDDIIIK